MMGVTSWVSTTDMEFLPDKLQTGTIVNNQLKQSRIWRSSHALISNDVEIPGFPLSGLTRLDNLARQQLPRCPVAKRTIHVRTHRHFDQVVINIALDAS